MGGLVVKCHRYRLNKEGIRRVEGVHPIFLLIISNRGLLFTYGGNQIFSVAPVVTHRR